jgi:hypothetical protein
MKTLLYMWSDLHNLNDEEMTKREEDDGECSREYPDVKPLAGIGSVFWPRLPDFWRTWTDSRTDHRSGTCFYRSAVRSPSPSHRIALQGLGPFG